MFAVFYALGPTFKQGYKQELFSNTDLYLLFTEILKLQPVKTDGSINNIQNMLKE
jgi:hypothetical protein